MYLMYVSYTFGRSNTQHFVNRKPATLPKNLNLFLRRHEHIYENKYKHKQHTFEKKNKDRNDGQIQQY